ERLRLFLRLCEPVAFAHRHGVVHRDLKPENVMVGPFGEVLVLDWGVARAPLAEAEKAAEIDARIASPPADSSNGTSAGAVIGTAGYMSPEQEGGDSALVEPRSDVFSLGRILAFVAAACGDEAPAPLASIVARATAPRIGERYASVSALADDVQRFL